MAKVNSYDRAQVSGKMNKKSKEVHRVRNGREHVYTIENPNMQPPSKAQKSYRALFGKITSTVNAIMSDPAQTAEWRQRMLNYHSTLDRVTNPTLKHYKTLRQFVFAVIREQLENKPAVRRRKANLPYVLPRGIRLHIAPFSDLSAADTYEILKARFNVFVCEQNIRYLDEDNIDYRATHIALRRRGKVIAYARLYQLAHSHTWQIGRLLTIDRNNGFGRFVMERAIEEAKRQGAAVIRIHAQVQTVAFYEKLGFKTVGKIFTEADIPHVCMGLS